MARFRLWGIFVLAFCCVAGCRLSLAAPVTHLLASAKVGADKQIHLFYRDGSEQVVVREKGAAGCETAKVASDERTAGWLVDIETPDQTYPIPLSLAIFRNGKIMRHFTPGQAIWDWQFLKYGQQVAFWMGPTHGDFIPHFELHDARTGRLLASWDGHTNEKHPAWVTGLKE